MPSTADVFVNNNLLLSRDVQPGPFTINNVPMTTGLRDMHLVVRDMLGREQTISQPYYASPSLLRQNLQEFSYEIGSIRNNYGLSSNDYGRLFAVGTHRMGFSEYLTGEGHAELLQNQQNMGLGGVFLSPTIGVFDAAIAGSHSQKGPGALLSMGFQRQTSWLSFGGHAQYADSQFAQLGLAQDRPAPKLLSSLHLGISNNGYGSFSLNHIYQQYRDQSNVNLINANYNLTLGKDWFLNLSAFNSLSNDNNKGIALVLSRTLGERTSASLTTGLQNNSPSALMQVQQNIPPGSGLGYRVLAGYNESERIESGVTMQNDVGTYNLDASRFQGQNNFRGSASGGLAIMGGDAFFSRRINSSFAVVQVPDYPNVHVYAENQLVATTNAWGNALVPALRPYQENHIRIEQADLPLDAKIDTLTINAAPYFRSGFLLKFPVRRSRGATMKIVLDNGQPLPAGRHGANHRSSRKSFRLLCMAMFISQDLHRTIICAYSGMSKAARLKSLFLKLKNRCPIWAHLPVMECTMKKCRNHPFKQFHLDNPRPRQGNSFFSLTAALLGVILSLTSTPAAALGLNCSFCATGVAFGNYNPTSSSPTDATGNVHVFCTVLLISVASTINISLNPGTGNSGSFSPRKMSSGANRLSYNLYKDTSHTTVWGDGTGGTSIWTNSNLLILVAGTPIDHTIYGRIPAGQYVAAGSYTDTITVTVEYHEGL